MNTSAKNTCLEMGIFYMVNYELSFIKLPLALI